MKKTVSITLSLLVSSFLTMGCEDSSKEKEGTTGTTSTSIESSPTTQDDNIDSNVIAPNDDIPAVAEEEIYTNNLFGNYHYNTGNEARQLAMYKDYAYVANSKNGFTIFDVSSSLERPEKVKDTRVTNPLKDDRVESVRSLEIEGDYLYLAHSKGGLQIRDLSIDKANPEFVSQLSFGEYGSDQAESVASKGNYAYVGTDRGLNVIDISNKKEPTLVEELPLYGADNLTIDGNYLYVPSSNFGLYIVDISNPTNAVVVGSFDVDALRTGVRDEYPVDVEIANGYAYIAAGSMGIIVLDIKNPQSPVLVSSNRFSELTNAVGVNFLAVTFFQDHLYVGNESERQLVIIDASNPNKLKKLVTKETHGDVRDVVLYKSNVYLASGLDGFYQYIFLEGY